MMHRLDEVLTETAVVRKELGYPGMATPFSQLVGTQAVLNILTGKRYSVIPDEVIQYAAKFYGEPAGPIDPNILDQILSSPRGKEVSSTPPPQPSIEELRKQYGTDDDDELILRALVPEADLNKMWAAGPIKKTYPLLSTPELDQARRLMSIANSPVVQLKSAGLELSLRKKA
jgi:oxaloacetate decarboxylase alpha subunit